MNGFSKGDKVEWNWGNGTGNGRVVERFDDTVCRTIDGVEIKRKADRNCPAYLIKQEDGSEVLKSHSELSAA